MQSELFADRYQIQDPIGRSGMSTIYRGRDLRTDRVVAIKVLRDIYSTNATTTEERIAHARFSSPHV